LKRLSSKGGNSQPERRKPFLRGSADFHGDGYPDLAEIAASNTSIEVLLNNAKW
jgi:hypothetical protein